MYTIIKSVFFFRPTHLPSLPHYLSTTPPPSPPSLLPPYSHLLSLSPPSLFSPPLHYPPELPPELQILLKRCDDQPLVSLLQSSQLSPPLQERLPLTDIKLVCTHGWVPGRPEGERERERERERLKHNVKICPIRGLHLFLRWEVLTFKLLVISSY